MPLDDKLYNKNMGLNQKIKSLEVLAGFLKLSDLPLPPVMDPVTVEIKNGNGDQDKNCRTYQPTDSRKSQGGPDLFPSFFQLDYYHRKHP